MRLSKFIIQQFIIQNYLR